MFDLLDRLERMGPRGAPISLTLGALLALVAVGLIFRDLTGTIDSRWAGLGLRGLAFFCGVFGLLFAMMGSRQIWGTRYPDPGDVFPSLPGPEFRAAMYAEPRPLCACSDCRIHLPANFSTGACPACSSSVNWHHVDTDDDADLVCSALHAD